EGPLRRRDYLNCTPMIRKSGRWMTDDRGRVVVMHGVNIVNKLPPYDPAAIGFANEDVEFLAAHGFNTLRLGVIWKALEPRPGEYDDGYLDGIAEVVGSCREAAISVLVEFHQGMLTGRYTAEGWPHWPALNDGR